MINNKKKQKYETPEMEVLKARVERGFTMSGMEEPEQGPRYSKGNELGNKFN